MLTFMYVFCSPGGRGNDKLTPVLFSVNHATEQSNNKQKVEADLKSGKNAVKSPVNFLSGGDVSTGSGTSTSSSSSSSKNSTAIQSPSSLLSALRNENRNNEESARDIIELSINPDKEKEKKRQQPVVSDVNNSNSTSSSSSSHRIDKTASGIKKGFLESSQMKDKSIYPESGSAEGTGGAKGGSLARVMDKCRVINMADMTSTGPSQSQSQSHSVNSNSKSIGSSNQSILVSEVSQFSLNGMGWDGMGFSCSCSCSSKCC